MNNWGKVLWRKPDHSDNYIHPQSFLSSLQKNPNFTPYEYWPLVKLTFAVTQQLSIIFIFLSTFVWLKEARLDPRTIIALSVICYVLGYSIWAVCSSWLANGYNLHLKALKSSILVFFALMSLSPMLRTLSAATSSDSIWALSAILFGINILLADYRISKKEGHPREQLSSVLSINAAISSSVVLASRLATDMAVFALILFSVQVFALFPMLRHQLRAMRTSVQAWMTLSLAVCAVWSAATISRLVAFIYLLIFCFITLVAPGVLVWAQRYKNEIRGPWDVAFPRVN